MTEEFQPLYPRLDGPLEPKATELYPITQHLASFFADGGSLLVDEDDAEETDVPPTLDELAVEYGGYGDADESELVGEWRDYVIAATGGDPDTWTGPTEAELPGIIAAIKRFARIGDIEMEDPE